MRNAYALLLSPCLLFTTSCSTLNESIQLGSTIGAVGGAAATSVAYSDAGVKPDSDVILTGAAIGLAVGAITSYITHKEVEQTRPVLNDDPQTYFGDLPPNPFVIPQSSKKGGK